MTEEGLNEKQRFLLATIRRNVTVLLRLINQTLDFRKWESGKLTMRLQEFDLSQGISEWSEVFKVLAEQRHIRFLIETGDEPLQMIADREKMERILYNLLSNAFKFTPDGGEVKVQLRSQGNEVQLYRKLKALTGSSPVELLRTMRLHRAQELLSTSGKSISEVTYEVGFSSPSYFTKCYKEAFGTTPTSKRN